MPLVKTCCGKTLSRTKEDSRFVWWRCWVCSAIYRMRLHMLPGEY